jgi:hypothetical protein
VGFDRVLRPRLGRGASGGGASYLPGMDFLEYQGRDPTRVAEIAVETPGARV